MDDGELMRLNHRIYKDNYFTIHIPKCVSNFISKYTYTRVLAFYPSYPLQIFHFTASRNNYEEAYLCGSIVHTTKQLVIF